jgi:acyl carrier protein
LAPAEREQNLANQKEGGKEEDAAGAEAFNFILESILKSTGADPSEIGEDTLIADLGVDSIMAIEITSMVNTGLGIELHASFVADYATIGDLRAEFGGSPGAPEATSQPTSSSAETFSPGSQEPEVVSKSESVSSLGSSVVNISTPENEEVVKSKGVQPMLRTRHRHPQPG